MLYTNPNIANLPTLAETVGILRDAVRQIPVIHRGPFTPILEAEHMSILTRTDTVYSIKPNITNQGVLFGWYNEFDADKSPVDSIRGSLYQEEQPNYLLQNIIREDFELVCEEHPLYVLLKRGISLPGLRRPISIYNPYGLAHSYGFKSPFISLTSSLDIAAFHASHKYDDETDSFEAITDHNKTGIIFVFEMNAPFAMIPGLSTVGRQAFHRPGLNRLFVYECRPDVMFASLPFVSGFQFRHSQDSSIQYGRKFDNGKSLFPKEFIADKALRLRKKRRYSECAFKRNLQYNPKDNADDNRRRLNAAGYSMVKNMDVGFTHEELMEMWFSNPGENWERFWKDTAFTMLNQDQLYRLIDLPNNPDYIQFFDLQKWIDRERI